MQQFIPFEDDWDALETLRPESLIPFRIGLPCTHDMADAGRSVHRAEGTLDLQLVTSSHTNATGRARS